MEQICKVEIFGVAGVVYDNTYNGSRNVRMSVAVNTNYGGHVATDWFNLVWWPDKCDNRVFGRGDIIHAEGRLVSYEYTSQEGEMRRGYEIRVNKIW